MLTFAAPVFEAKRVAMWFASLLAVVLAGGCGSRKSEPGIVEFDQPRNGFASVVITTSDGQVVRQLATVLPFAKGTQKIAWDGLDDLGQAVPAGDYRWKGFAHTGIRAILKGSACGSFGWSEQTSQGWGGDDGIPSAVAADEERVYLGWSKAVLGTAIVACDLDGRVLWGWRQPKTAEEMLSVSGVRALAVDAGVLYVLGNAHPQAGEGSTLLKFDAKTGAPVSWPNGEELRISSFWPADAKTRPDGASAMSARAGRIYLTFTEAQFLAVLDAASGAYLQTVVGAPPEFIDAVPTKTESTDRPGELMDADFVLISLRGGVLGKVLFAHDPLWVITSDLQPLDREERITALTVLGDTAPRHRHSAFVGLDAPFHQVQRRSLLSSEGFLWSAGYPGGRPESGPWIPEALADIRGMAIDARGRLWVAEGDASPPRFSVWSTEGTEGKLVAEFFSPVQGSGIAVFPGDPNVFAGAGCEWRIDPGTGQARCTGIITREWPFAVRFRKSGGSYELLMLRQKDHLDTFVRVEEGTYQASPSVPFAEGQGLPFEEMMAAHLLKETPSGAIHCGKATVARQQFDFVATGVPLEVLAPGEIVVAKLFQSPGWHPDGPVVPHPAPVPGTDFTQMKLSGLPAISQAADGKVYCGATDYAFRVLEITGLETVQPLPGGRVAVPPRRGR